jgi:hypothetical protein
MKDHRIGFDCYSVSVNQIIKRVVRRGWPSSNATGAGGD